MNNERILQATERFVESAGDGAIIRKDKADAWIALALASAVVDPVFFALGYFGLTSATIESAPPVFAAMGALVGIGFGKAESARKASDWLEWTLVSLAPVVFMVAFMIMLLAEGLRSA